MKYGKQKAKKHMAKMQQGAVKKADYHFLSELSVEITNGFEVDSGLQRSGVRFFVKIFLG